MEEASDRVERERETRGGYTGRRKPRWTTVLDEATNPCPDCGSTNSHIYKTQHIHDRTVKRVRECRRCGMTVERHEQVTDVDLDDHRAAQRRDAT